MFFRILNKHLSRISDSLIRINYNLWAIRILLTPKPIKLFPIGPVTLLSERRVDNMDFLTYKVELKVSPSSDVKTRQLNVKQSLSGTSVADDNFDLALDATETTVEVRQDHDVVLQETVTDDGGNPTVGEALGFNAKDTMPPAVGGALTATGPISERTE